MPPLLFSQAPTPSPQPLLLTPAATPASPRASAGWASGAAPGQAPSEARVWSHTQCLPHPLPPGTPHRAAVGGNRTVTGPICQVQHLGATKNLFSTL